MGGYREKVEPTAEGLEELDESTSHATIDRLIAAIQHKRLSPEKVIDLTQHFRNRQSVEEKELFRLGKMSFGYNRKWATNHNRCFGNKQVVLDKRQSQYKSWREMLKATTPRYKAAPCDSENPRSTYQNSFLTHQPYEQDMWGPASYGRLVYDLWDTIDTTIHHMDEGKELCDDMIAKEKEIDNDPERKKELFWDQYYKEAERNSAVIESQVRKGVVDIDNPEYQRMLSFSDTNTYAISDFHQRTETGFSGFVVTNETLAAQNNQITHKEITLFGSNPDRINRVRFLIDHLEELLSLKGQRFDKVDTMYFIKWCNVKKSDKKTKDNEHELFDYICRRRTGSLRFYGWPCLFELRKQMNEDDWKKPVAVLNKKIIDLWNTYNDEPWEPEK